MIVYIEQVIIDNIVVNYFLLWFCSVLLKEKKSVARFLLASGVGTLFAFVFPMLEISQILLIFLKTMLCVLIILLAFPYKKLKNLFVLCASFFVSTFLLGGVVIGLLVNTFANYSLTNGTFSYVSSVPIGVFILLGFLLFKAFYDLIIASKNKAKLEKMTFELSVHYLNRITKIKAFLDTGNLLVDTKTSLPIIVINFKVFKQILNIKTEQFLLGEYDVKNKRYQKFETANKQSKMLVFEVDKICVKFQNETKVINQAVLGLALNNFSTKLNCDALVGMNLIEMGEVND